MSALNKQIVINPEEYTKRWGVNMSRSLEDAFNDILSDFTDSKIDSVYNSEMNQFLTNDKGDVYYFDNFKYIYPRSVGEDETFMRCLNTNNQDECVVVERSANAIIVKKFKGNSNLEVTSYYLIPDTYDRLSQGDLNGDMGQFLLQVSGDNNTVLSSLEYGTKITVKRELGNLVCYDDYGNVLETKNNTKPTGKSFYNEVKSELNIYNLLTQAYSNKLSNKEESGKGAR